MSKRRGLSRSLAPPAGRTVGFAVQLKRRPGLAVDDSLGLERQFSAYVAAQGLELVDDGLQLFVKAGRREVMVIDQVLLIDWLVDWPGLVAVRIGPVTARASIDAVEAGADDQTFIETRTADLTVIGLTLLYRCGRITPALYLQILAGDARPAHGH